MKVFGKQRRVFVTVAIILLAFLLRIPHLGGSFWLDEAAQVLESNRPLAQQLMIRDDFQPPLIHLIVHALLQVSHSEAWLRFGAALLPALVSLWVVIHIGEKFFGTRSGWLAGLLLSTSSFHIFYSQELRPYSLPALFAVVSWWAIYELLHGKQRARRWLITLCLSSVAGLYSSYLYPFVLVGQGIFILSQWKKDASAVRSTLAAVVISGLAFIPWLPSLYEQVTAGQQLRQDFVGWENIVSFDQVKSLSLVVGKFLFGVLDLQLSLYFIAILMLCIAGVGYLLWKTRASLNRQLLWSLCCWFILPIGLAWIVSFWIPIVQPKRVLFALPAMYLFIGCLVARAIKMKTTSMWGYALLLLLLSINLFSTFKYYTDSSYHRENWREIQQYISRKYDPQKSIVLFAFTNQFASWEWYNKGTFPTTSTQVFTVSNDPESPERMLIKQLTDYQYILVFDYLRDLTDPNRIIEADLLRYGYQQVDVIPGNTALGQVRVFARSRQILGYSEY
jgi:uncharacterized membrane protein